MALLAISSKARLRVRGSRGGGDTNLKRVGAVLVVPDFAWEVFLAIYMTFKGFKQSPVLHSDSPVAVVDGGFETSAVTGTRCSQHRSIDERKTNDQDKTSHRKGATRVAMDWHDTLMGSLLIISGGLTFAYTRAASKILLILTLIGAAATIVIGVLLFFHLA